MLDLYRCRKLQLSLYQGKGFGDGQVEEGPLFRSGISVRVDTGRFLLYLVYTTLQEHGARPVGDVYFADVHSPVAVHEDTEQIMDLHSARAIVKTLANGIHPKTGEVFSQTSPYNDPEVIRALFVIGEFVRRTTRQPETVEEKQQANIDLGRPKNYGLLWSAEDRERVASQFKAGSSIADIASNLERSQGSINGELVRQGLVEPPEDGRWFGAASAASSKRSS